MNSERQRETGGTSKVGDSSVDGDSTMDLDIFQNIMIWHNMYAIYLLDCASIMDKLWL